VTGKDPYGIELASFSCFTCHYSPVCTVWETMGFRVTDLDFYPSSAVSWLCK
jgi:hypothetical protein